MISYTIKRDVLKEPLIAAIHHWRHEYRIARDQHEGDEFVPVIITHHIADLRRTTEQLKTLLSTIDQMQSVDGRRKHRIESYTLSQDMYETIFEI